MTTDEVAAPNSKRVKVSRSVEVASSLLLATGSATNVDTPRGAAAQNRVTQPGHVASGSVTSPTKRKRGEDAQQEHVKDEIEARASKRPKVVIAAPESTPARNSTDTGTVTVEANDQEVPAEATKPMPGSRTEEEEDEVEVEVEVEVETDEDEEDEVEELVQVDVEMQDEEVVPKLPVGARALASKLRPLSQFLSQGLRELRRSLVRRLLAGGSRRA